MSVFTERRVGYRMLKVETPSGGTADNSLSQCSIRMLRAPSAVMSGKVVVGGKVEVTPPTPDTSHYWNRESLMRRQAT